MSMINEPIDYNTLLTWKLSPKKSVEHKNDTPVNIYLATTKENNLESHINLCGQENIISKQFTHNATIQEYHISNQPGLMFSHLPNHLNGTIQVQQFKPNENIHIQQMVSIPTQNVLPFQPEQQSVKNTPKQKNMVLKKKKKIPLDGLTYHSKQLGLRVPPKKVKL